VAGTPPQVNRWALRLDQPPANPHAGQLVGHTPHKGDAAMTGGGAGGTWHPTVVGLLVLIVLEILGYGLLRWAFRTAHGG
jgi:hypothetical protein